MCSLLIGSSPFRTQRDELAVALDQRLDGEAHLFLGEAAHFEQPRLELLELLLEMPSVAFEFHGFNQTAP